MFVGNYQALANRQGLSPSDPDAFAVFDGRFSTAGLQPPFAPAAPGTTSATFSYQSGGGTPGVDPPTISLTDVAIPGGSYDLDLWIGIDVSYALDTTAGTFSSTVEVDMQYHYVASGSYGSTLLGGSSHAYDQEQTGGWQFDFQAGGTASESGGSVTLDGDFATSEDGWFDYSHVEDASYVDLGQFGSAHGGVAQSTTGDYSFRHADYGSGGNAAFSIGPSGASAGAFFDHYESGRVDASLTNDASYTYLGAVADLESSAHVRAEVRGYGFTNGEEGAYSHQDADLTVLASVAQRAAEFDYDMSASDTASYHLLHSDASASGSYTTAETATRTTVLDELGSYTAVNGLANLTLLGATQHDSGSRTLAVTEDGAQTQTNTSGTTSGAYSVSATETFGYGYDDQLLPGQQYQFAAGPGGYSGYLAGTFAQSESGTTSANYTVDGGYSRQSGLSTWDGTFAQSAVRSATTSGSDEGIYYESPPGGAAERVVLGGLATHDEQSQGASSYSASGSYSDTTSGASTAGEFDVGHQVTGTAASSESAHYSTVTGSRFATVDYSSSEDFTGSASLSSSQTTQDSAGSHWSQIVESNAFTNADTDDGLYAADDSGVTSRSGSAAHTETASFTRHTTGNGQQITAGATETLGYSAEETEGGDSSSLQTTSYEETSLGRSQSGDFAREDSRQRSVSRHETIDYDSGGRTGAAGNTRSETASFDYEDSGTWVDDFVSGVHSRNGDFTRDEYVERSASATDAGTFVAADAIETYDTIRTDSATSGYFIDDGSFSEDAAGRYESGNFQLRKSRIQAVDSSTTGTSTATAGVTTTVSDYNTQLGSQASFYYREQGSYADDPNGRSTQAEFERAELSQQSSDRFEHEQYTVAAAGEDPGGAGGGTATAEDHGDRTYVERGNYTSTGAGLEKWGDYHLDEASSTESEGDGSFTAADGLASSHSSERAQADVDYTEAGQFHDAPTGNSRSADFERIEDLYRWTSASSDVNYVDSASRGVATTIETGETRTTIHDEGRFATDPNGRLRTGTLETDEKGSGNTQYDDLGSFRGGTLGSYETHESGVVNSSFSQTANYDESSGFAAGNGTWRDGDYVSLSAQQSDSSTSASRVYLEGGAAKIGNSASSGTTTAFYSETGDFTESPTADDRESQFRSFNGTSASQSGQLTSIAAHSSPLGPVVATGGNQQTSTSDYSYSESGTLNDHVAHAVGDADDHHASASYSQRETHHTLAVGSSTQVTAVSVTDADPSDGHLLDDFWVNAELQPLYADNVVQGVTRGSYNVDGPFFFGRGATILGGDDAMITGTISLVGSSTLVASETLETPQGAYEVDNGQRSESYSYNEQTSSTSDAGSTGSTSLHYELSQTGNGDSVQDTVDVSLDRSSVYHGTSERSTSGSYHLALTGGALDAGSFSATNQSETTESGGGGGSRSYGWSQADGEPETHYGNGDFTASDYSSRTTSYQESGSYTNDSAAGSHNSASFTNSDSHTATTVETESATVTMTGDGEEYVAEASDSHSGDYQHQYNSSGTLESFDDTLSENSSYQTDDSRTDNVSFSLSYSESALSEETSSSVSAAVIETYDVDGVTTTDLPFPPATGEDWTRTLVDIYAYDDDTPQSYTLIQDSNSITTTPDTPGLLESAWNWLTADIHNFLDVAGIIPSPLAPFFDLANASLYLLEGDLGNASLSAVGAVPILGDTLQISARATRGGLRAINAAELAGKSIRGAGRIAGGASDVIAAGRSVVRSGVAASAEVVRRAGRAAAAHLPASKCDIPVLNRAFKWCFAPGTQVVIVGPTAAQFLRGERGAGDVLVVEAAGRNPGDFPRPVGPEDAAAESSEWGAAGAWAAAAAGLLGAQVALTYDRRRDRAHRRATRKSARPAMRYAPSRHSIDLSDPLVHEEAMDRLHHAGGDDDDALVCAPDRIGRSWHSVDDALSGPTAQDPSTSVLDAAFVAVAATECSRGVGQQRSVALATVGAPQRTGKSSMRPLPHAAPRKRESNATDRRWSGRAVARAWLAAWLLVAAAWLGWSRGHDEPPPSAARGAVAPAIVPTSPSGECSARQASPRPPASAPLPPAEPPPDALDLQTTCNIEDLQPGDWVLARDARDGRLAAKRVVRLFRNETDHLRLLTIDDDAGGSQTIRTTDDHKFYVHRVGWLDADALTAGDRLIQADGQLATVAATARESCPPGTIVYNFEVEDAHTYFVAAAPVRGPPATAVWVHNTCSDELATIRSLRKHAERLVRGHRAAKLKHLGDKADDVRTAINAEKFNLAGTYFHKLLKDLVVEAKKKGLKAVEPNPEVIISNGVKGKRIPDFRLFEKTIYDLKVFRHTADAYNKTSQFKDLEKATGFWPIALYYRLW